MLSQLVRMIYYLYLHLEVVYWLDFKVIMPGYLFFLSKPTSVSFDQFKCTDRHFRFGSVGEDTRLCLWEFTTHSLRRSKTLSMSRAKSLQELSSSTASGFVIHTVSPKNAVPIIEPILV